MVHDRRWYSIRRGPTVYGPVVPHKDRTLRQATGSHMRDTDDLASVTCYKSFRRGRYDPKILQASKLPVPKATTPPAMDAIAALSPMNSLLSPMTRSLPMSSSKTSCYKLHRYISLLPANPFPPSRYYDTSRIPGSKHSNNPTAALSQSHPFLSLIPRSDRGRESPACMAGFFLLSRALHVHAHSKATDFGILLLEQIQST